MASQGFVLRLRTPSGMKRLAFKSDKDTFQTLQQVVQAETKIAPNEQMLSTTPLVSPNFLNAAPSTTLAALKLKHGDILHIVDTSAPAPTKPTPSSTPSSSQPSSQPSQPTSTVKLTRDCKHGPNGRCIHCDGAPIVSSALKTRMPCSHGSNATCPNCSEYVNSSENKDQLPTWLCNHPESAFCPMCIPKDDDEKGVRGLKCSCNKSKGQQCLNCIETKPAMKVDLVPYAQYMKERRALCKFSHQPTVICASCAPPRMEDYKGKRNCDRGHKPWPYAVCLNCAPPNANPRLQHYRHCDTVSFEDLNSIKTFYQDWMRRGPENQRAGILFGVYTDEPETSNLEGGIRAQVQAIYEPPQESNLKGVRFLKDPHEQAVHRVAGLLGLQPVGWIITTIPRSGPKYGGKVFLSGSEIKQAARFQNRYKNELGFSRFVTVVVEHAQHVAPDAYQVSDQCVALERDGVLAPAQDPFMLTTHVPAQGEIVPTFIWKGKRLEPGKEFLPDEFIVKLIISASGQPRPMFRFTEFHISGGEQELKTYLLRHAREEYHVKLSDFNLLCFLPSVLSMPLAEQVCAALVTGERFPNELKGALDRAFAAKKLI